jgi:hypothetical protein
MGGLVWQFIRHWWAYMSCALDFSGLFWPFGSSYITRATGFDLYLCRASGTVISLRDFYDCL